MLRLTRTYPNTKFKNIGLQAFMFGKYSKYSSTFFFKKNKHKFIKNRRDTKIYEINMKERSLRDNYSLSINFILVLINKFIDNIYLFKNILNKINFEKIKYIHVHNINFLLTAVLINLIFKKKIILSIGGSDIYNLKRKILFNFLIKRVSLVLSVSEQLQNEFNKIYPKKICEVMGNGVDLNFYKYKKIKKKNIILAVGNIRWQKDYLTLAKAFNEFQKVNENFKLYICGEVYDRAEYEKISKYLIKNSIFNKVIFTGYLDSRKIRNLIYSSKILVISSVSEGLPKVLLEGISCGTPIISTNVGDNPKILNDKSLIIPKKNHKKMFTTINSLINSKKKYSRITEKFFSKRKSFNWKNVVTKTEKIINKHIC